MADVDFTTGLRNSLIEAGFTVDGVAEVLGEQAHKALARNETTPGLRRTQGGTPRETLTRLFLLQAPVTHEAAEAALPGQIDALCNAGLLEQSLSEVAARMDCRPYAADDADLWVVSDLTPGLDGFTNNVGTDHVLGISSASTSLAQLTLREPVDKALDLGTGCGVQALHMASHARSVVATDVNKRALWTAQVNAALNQVDVDIREGSFWEPVAGEKFDLIATNPPFVISPATGERLVYRDSGLPGDRVVEDIVRAAPGHLNDGGWCQVLANWIIEKDRSWDERLATWLDESCDAFVVQREVLDPAQYVELWLRDGGDIGSANYVLRYDTWLNWFEQQGIEAVGFGWINLRRGGTGIHELLQWPHAVEQPIAPAIGAWGETTGYRVEPSSVLTMRADVRQETVGAPGAEDPAQVVLRQQRGLCRARSVDTVEAALVGACDGDLSVGAILDALGVILDQDSAEMRVSYLPVVDQLVYEGYLEPLA